MSTRLEEELTDVRKKGDLRWSRPDGKTQVTIEYVPRVADEIVGVVRLIPQERVQLRTVEQIVNVPVPQVFGVKVELVQIIPQERISKRVVGRIVGVLDHPDCSEGSGGSTSAVL